MLIIPPLDPQFPIVASSYVVKPEAMRSALDLVDSRPADDEDEDQ